MTRASSILLLCVACALAALPAAPAGAAADDAPRTIRWADGQVTQIGSLRTRPSRTRVPTIARAIAAFGKPRSSKLDSTNSCVVSWPALGLRGTFANFGATSAGQTTCSPSVGKLQTATIRGRGFRTQRGLRVGQSTARLQSLHSGARFRQGSWLATTPAVVGDVKPGERFAIVRAIVQRGVVTSFVLEIGGAGE